MFLMHFIAATSVLQTVINMLVMFPYAFIFSFVSVTVFLMRFTVTTSVLQTVINTLAIYNNTLYIRKNSNIHYSKLYCIIPYILFTAPRLATGGSYITGLSILPIIEFILLPYLVP